MRVRARVTVTPLLAGVAGAAVALAALLASAAGASAAASVTIAGSLQSEIGCAGDWQPDCAAAHLTYDPGDGVWQGTFSLPAGSYEYKAAIDDSWLVNYGAGGVLNGANIPLNLAAGRAVKFYYSDATHGVADDAGALIATFAGSFQSELGCPGDWQPDCLRSWLQDLDGDGVATFETTALPPGSYEGKVTIGESWTENYGAGGVPGGANLGFTVTHAGQAVRFSYDAATHVPAVSALVQASFVSVAAQDGTVVEANDLSGRGAWVDARATTVRVGDDALGRQHRAVLSFDTGSLPDAAVVVSATLKVRFHGQTPSPVFDTHGKLLVDARRGSFSGSVALQPGDFQAPATRLAAAVVPNGGVGWFSAAVPPKLVNRAGPTQLRLRFARANDDDGAADIVEFYSANAREVKRPILEVVYFLP